MAQHIAQWGNSLAVRLPLVLTKKLALQAGSAVEVKLNNGRIVIRPCRQIYRLEELLQGITTANRHAENDWGQAAGREVW